MMRLTYEKHTRDRHHDYVRQTIEERLESARQSPFNLSEESEKKLLLSIPYAGTPKQFRTVFNSQRDKFYEYIRNNIERLAIGEPSILRGVEQEISADFPLVHDVLRHHEQDPAFSDHVYDIFGYERFKVGTLFELFKSATKAKLDIDQKKRFLPKHRQVFRDTLSSLLPEKKQMIESQLSDKSCPDIKSFEKAFYDIPDVYLTLTNMMDSRVFEKTWSDYALVMLGGVKVCPYCNRQYVTPFLSGRGKVRADLDHFFSKRRYPYFSMSLYNLVPSCKQCNQSLKGSKEFSVGAIHPFEHDLDPNFRFRASPKWGRKGIRIDVQALITHHKIEHVEEYIDMFKLRPLYGYHVNHAEDIIEKKLMYPDELLLKLLPRTRFKNLEEIRAFVIGYVADNNQINEEPLNKLRRDLAIQMGFISDTSTVDTTLIARLEKLIR